MRGIRLGSRDAGRHEGEKNWHPVPGVGGTWARLSPGQPLAAVSRPTEDSGDKRLMATAKNSLAPIFVGLLLLVVVGGGAYWLITSDTSPAEKPVTVETPKAPAPEPVKPTAEQRTSLAPGNASFDAPVKVKVV